MMPKFLPMLAAAGEPFDSPQHLFEVKWDGVRALAAVEHGGWQLWGRDLADYTPRYPGLEVLGRWPSGTVVDGELVVLRDGRAKLDAILRRHQLVSPRKIKYAGRQWPATYVLFDLVYWQGRALFDRPLAERRARLEELLEGLQEPRLAFSTGVVGPTGWPRAVSRPGLPQTRTCAINAFGSSSNTFASTTTNRRREPVGRYPLDLR